MCGIAGVVGLVDASTITAMTEALVHRGPDDSGTLVLDREQVMLGHRRLSIIDLSLAGHQPMSTADARLWITFNGEIYNYRAIRRELTHLGYRFRSDSDTEVLLAAYQAWGEACLDRLNGMFAFAIYDSGNRSLFAARDRLGIKPFYYFYKPGLFVFASEIKALTRCDAVPKRPDFAALATPVRFQVPPHTGFADIRKLPAGHWLRYADGQLKMQSYWSLSPIEEGSTQLSAMAELDDLLNDAIKLQMISDVPVGVFLSGGLDSSLIAALMRKNTNRDIHAFTIRFSEADQRYERMPDDSKYARRVATGLGLEYHEFEIEPDVAAALTKMVWHLDEPLSDPAAINTYLIAQAARDNNIIVLLNGMGGDEIFGGYRKHLACVRAELYQQLVPLLVRNIVESGVRRVPVANRARGFRSIRWAKRFLSFASLSELDRFLASDLSLSWDRYREMFPNAAPYADSYYYRVQKALFDKAKGSYLTKMCLSDTKFFLPEHNLLYSDKATMAAGIESRPPLTDHRLAELMFSLAPTYRIRGNQQKYLLKKVAEKYLPADVVYRPKAPFGSPLRAWMRGPLAPMIDDLLTDTRMRAGELYDAKAVRRMVLRDRAGQEDNALQIWTVLTNELWFRTHFG